MKNEYVDLFDYNTWANERIFGIVSDLSDEEFNRELKSSFASVRQTLVHLVSAEWIWLRRWLGESPKGVPSDWDTSSADLIKRLWTENNRGLMHFIQNMNDPDRMVEYRNIKGDAFGEPLSVQVRHVVNHSTYHRGQITTWVRHLGRAGISTDYVAYYREQTKRT